MAYECSLCSGDENAALLITPLTGGETMAVGPSCMGIALIGMAAGHYEVDAEKLMAAVDRLVKKAQADAAKGTGDGEQAAEVGDACPEGCSCQPCLDGYCSKCVQGTGPHGALGGPEGPARPPSDPAEGGPVAQLPQRPSRHARADQ